MYDHKSGLPQPQHPLEVLASIERQGTVDQELLLRDSVTPWADLLAVHVDNLNELASRAAESNDFIVTYGLDEGHAGGCG
ncbi:hypothetical protein OG594_37995 [Streptomyces sp. NBC_01214]|nr:DUF6269 family protein [Streptomyces sp. NBC_01214]MCX4807344.1 hypothetical protein [Streptomyces sp. NBC_01214]